MKALALTLLAVLSVLSGCASKDASVAVQNGPSAFTPTEGVDHVLLWTREVEEDSRVLSDKLGFNVVPGGTFPDNVANRLVYFRDRSYLELLYFTVPLSQVGADSLKGIEFLARRDGSVGFGIRVDNLESTAARVASAGLSTGELSPGAFDPDGPDGPLTESAVQFRTFGFESPPIAGLDPFFVWYGPRPARDAEAQARWLTRTTHPNSAERLTAVWILPADAAASAAALSKMGFLAGARVPMPQIGGIGTIFRGGQSSILLVEPRGSGIAREALRARGPHVLGVSIEVADLAAAKGVIARSYGPTIPTYQGAFGKAVLGDAQDDLGVLIEFHVAD